MVAISNKQDRVESRTAACKQISPEPEENVHRRAGFKASIADFNSGEYNKERQEKSALP